MNMYKKYNAVHYKFLFFPSAFIILNYYIHIIGIIIIKHSIYWLFVCAARYYVVVSPLTIIRNTCIQAAAADHVAAAKCAAL